MYFTSAMNTGCLTSITHNGSNNDWTIGRIPHEKTITVYCCKLQQITTHSRCNHNNRIKSSTLTLSMSYLQCMRGVNYGVFYLDGLKYHVRVNHSTTLNYNKTDDCEFNERITEQFYKADFLKFLEL